MSSSSQSNEPHLHAYKITRIAPTCTSEGYTLYQCSCGAEKREDFLPAKGHTWGEWEVLEKPTFTELGKKKRSCTVCGVTESENIQKLSEDDFIDETQYKLNLFIQAFDIALDKFLEHGSMSEFIEELKYNDFTNEQIQNLGIDESYILDICSKEKGRD